MTKHLTLHFHLQVEKILHLAKLWRIGLVLSISTQKISHQDVQKKLVHLGDSAAEFADLNIDVFGISRDSIESHHKFKKEHDLPFELLTDKSGEVCKKYKALIPFVGVPKRITYLLDKSHKIAAVFDSMFNAAGHIEAMIEEVKKA